MNTSTLYVRNVPADRLCTLGLMACGTAVAETAAEPGRSGLRQCAVHLDLSLARARSNGFEIVDERAGEPAKETT